MSAKKKLQLEINAGPRILVMLEPGANGARAMELACLAGREAHAVIHVAGPAVERAVQQARLFHMRVVTEGGTATGTAEETLRLVRRLRPGTLVLATTRPALSWEGFRRQLGIRNILRRAGCEVIIVRT